MSTRASLPLFSPSPCKVCYAADRDGTSGGTGASENNDALLKPDEHVLSTLEADGSRRWLRPRLSMGEWWKRRRVTAYILMVVFVAIPHLRIAGKPLILLDIAAREFTVLGKTFYPTDTLVLALFMLSVFVSIVLITAITGRAWCGWACPQTVYMEFLFRPIDRFFDGTVGKGGKPARGISPVWQIARFGVYLVLCMFLAHTFLAYFVGTEKLAQWVRSSPIDHPSAFLVMAGTTGLMLFDFLFFREQLCLIACPYGRFQSVMLDEQSKIVAYDPVRGEPRIKGKRTHDDERGVDLVRGKAAGDCVDCHQCVVVCPTGIDIRDGLQMECVNCTQCIDACDDVMEKVGKPKGLIRFSSQDAIARKPKKLLRARTIIYPIVLVGVFSGLAMAISSKSGFDARILRGRGAPYSLLGAKEVSNAFNLRLVNRTEIAQTYELSTNDSSVEVEIIDTDAQHLEPAESKLLPIRLNFPSSMTMGDGNESIELTVKDQSGNERIISMKVLGPRR